MKALFVDEDMQVDVLVRVLRNRYPNDTFQMAYTLAEATDIIWKTRYNVIVMDIMLPADESAVPGSSEDAGLIAGLLLLDMMRDAKACANRKSPVILLTGVPPELHERIRAAQEQYQSNYYQKPVLPDVLYNAMKAAVGEVQT